MNTPTDMRPTDPLLAIQSIQRLQVQPGDVIVISVPFRLHREATEYIRATVDRHLPGVPVIVLDAGSTLQVVNADQAGQLARAAA